MIHSCLLNDIDTFILFCRFPCISHDDSLFVRKNDTAKDLQNFKFMNTYCRSSDKVPLPNR